MITEAVVAVFVALVRFGIGLIPTGNPPGWLANGNGFLADIWAAGAGLGAWIPWSLVGTVFAAVLASIAVGFTIKLVRIVVSFLTVGGGSAG